MSFATLRASLEINLKRRDLQKARVLSRYIDLLNIRSLFLEEPIDTRGNLSEKELDEALLVQSMLPDYVFDFLNQFHSVADKVRHFGGLLARFFATEVENQSGFLRAYLTFEREWRLVMVALKAHQLKRDLVRELQFEDAADPLVAQILAQKDAADYDPPADFQELKQLLFSCGLDPWRQNLVATQWRLRRIEELVERPLFSIDWILAYVARFLIVEQWHELDPQRGKMVLDTWVRT